jgi:hypothetical protein
LQPMEGGLDLERFLPLMEPPSPSMVRFALD